MLGSVGSVVGGVAYGRWRAKINSSIASAFKRAYKILIGPKFCKVAETFCNEVAVLWFVFPLLDTLYQHGNMNDPLIREGFGVSGVFFVFAVVLSHLTGEED